MTLTPFSIFFSLDTLAIFIAGFVFGVVFFKYDMKLFDTTIPLFIFIVSSILFLLLRDEFYVSLSSTIAILALGFAIGMLLRCGVRNLIRKIAEKKKKKWKKSKNI